jgi:hypothetical protein
MLLSLKPHIQTLKITSGVIFGEDSQLNELGPSAFYKTRLRSIRLPNALQKISWQCFLECTELDEVIFQRGSNLNEIGSLAFSKSGLKSIRIPKGVIKIPCQCFLQCAALCDVFFEEDSKLNEIGVSVTINFTFSKI